MAVTIVGVEEAGQITMVGVVEVVQIMEQEEEEIKMEAGVMTQVYSKFVDS